MGQKVHPIGLRLGIVKNWNSVWYAERGEFANNLSADFAVREHIRKKLSNAFISGVKIRRPAKNVQIVIQTARPGIVIGKKGEDVEKLRKNVSKIMGVPTVNIVVEEIRNPDLDAQLVASNITNQLERRIMFRRAMRRSVNNSIRFGAKGIKIKISGRLNGAEIARSECYREGQMPLHTLRADIDYGVSEAHTAYGLIGVKVWIYKGEIF